MRRASFSGFGGIGGAMGGFVGVGRRMSRAEVRRSSVVCERFGACEVWDGCCGG